MMEEAEKQAQRIVELEKRLAEIEHDYEVFKDKYLSGRLAQNELFDALIKKQQRFEDAFYIFANGVLQHDKFLFPEKETELRSQLVTVMERTDKPL